MKINWCFSMVCVGALLCAWPAMGQTTQPAQNADRQARRQQYQEQRGNRRNRNFFASSSNGGTFAAPGEADDTPRPPDMMGDYLILTTRSIFYRGRFVPPDETPRQDTPLRQAEDELVFCGVFDASSGAGTVPTAFLEDSDSGQVSPVRVGDQIAQGKITAINLDELEYQSAGVTRHLSVGENLAGQQMWGGPTTMPINLDFSGPSGDILKMMAARRLKELNGTAATPSGN
jgi:hypothetical protein